MQFGTFIMTKAKQDKIKCLFSLYSFNLNLNHREIWLPKWGGENVSRIGDHISCNFEPFTTLRSNTDSFTNFVTVKYATV